MSAVRGGGPGRAVPWWAWGVGLVLAGLGGWAVFLRPPPAPEELVQHQVVEIARLAEEHKVAPILELVSEHFRASGGGGGDFNESLGKEELRSVLAAQVLRGQWVRVFVTEIEPHLVSAGKVEVRARFIFGRSDAKELKNLARDSVMSAYEVTAQSEHEADGQWRFVDARWQRLDPAGLW